MFPSLSKIIGTMHPLRLCLLFIKPLEWYLENRVILKLGVKRRPNHLRQRRTQTCRWWSMNLRMSLLNHTASLRLTTIILFQPKHWLLNKSNSKPTICACHTRSIIKWELDISCKTRSWINFQLVIIANDRRDQYRRMILKEFRTFRPSILVRDGSKRIG
jgi:hypothetical protein